MAIQIQCPGCSDQVTATEADRGRSIKCGTCWTSVNIPAGSSSAVAKPVARPVPAVAKPAIAVAAAVVKAPVLATPVPAKPASKVDGKKAKEKPRFKRARPR